jgi:uncharacterized protein YidB (DUF937 family)
MGLLDGLINTIGGQAGGALGGLLGKDGQHKGLVQAILDSPGGLGGLLGRLQSGGLAGAVGSWIGTGANQPVTGEQVHAALPSDLVSQLAGRAGLDSAQVSSGLAQVLPNLVDKLTPSGSLPQGNGLQDALGGLLGSLTGKAG